jgi:lipopolysaccharide export LptBFGC system permease protein LptF
MAWIRPAANQAFREFMFSRIAHDRNASTHTALPKGTNELTLAELRQRLRSRPDADRVDRNIEFTYHLVWALPWATLALALFALSVNRWRIRRVGLCAIALSTYFGYYLLLFTGRTYALDGTLPAFAAAWLPNIVFAASSVALAKAAQTNAAPA